MMSKLIVLACALFVVVEAGVNFIPDRGELRRSLLLSTVDLDDPSIDQASLNCLMQEGCIGASSGTRTLLRFTTEIANRGDTDYRAGIPPHEKVDQGPWHWDTCHLHWHFQDYANYVLRAIPPAQGDDDDGYNGHGANKTSLLIGRAPVIVGRKNGFCLMDVMGARIGNSFQRQECDMKKGCCDQGISSGCADIYSNALQCQWIDVTGVDFNMAYELEVEVNPNRRIREDNYDDNKITIPVNLNSVTEGPGIAFLSEPALDPGDCRDDWTPS